MEADSRFAKGMPRATLAGFKRLYASLLKDSHGSRNAGVYDMVMGEICRGTHHTIRGYRVRRSRAVHQAS
jgi:hypothetical protein